MWLLTLGLVPDLTNDIEGPIGQLGSDHKETLLGFLSLSLISKVYLQDTEFLHFFLLLNLDLCSLSLFFPPKFSAMA